jgi:hypothetical protein
VRVVGEGGGGGLGASGGGGAGAGPSPLPRIEIKVHRAVAVARHGHHGAHKPSQVAARHQRVRCGIVGTRRRPAAPTGTQTRPQRTLRQPRGVGLPVAIRN